MKRVIMIFIFCFLLPASVFAASYFYGIILSGQPAGFIAGGSGGAPAGDALLLESNDYLLLESGDKLLLE